MRNNPSYQKFKENVETSGLTASQIDALDKEQVAEAAATNTDEITDEFAANLKGSVKIELQQKQNEHTLQIINSCLETGIRKDFPDFETMFENREIDKRYIVIALDGFPIRKEEELNG
jgi:hypothetical protein